MSDLGMTVGLIKALAPKPDPEDIKQSVEDWLEDHPEATTTVQDGAITKAKLNASLQGTVDDVDELKNAVNQSYSGLVHFVVKDNTYISSTNGSEIYYSGWRATDFISISGDVVYSSGSDNTGNYNAFYDSSKAFISAFRTQAGVNTPVIPNNAAYFRLSGSNANIASIKVYTNIKNQIADNAEAIAENTNAIMDIVAGTNNKYEGHELMVGRVYNGVYDSTATVHCTDFIPIVPGNTYAIYGGLITAEYSNYYNKNKVYKGSLPLSNVITTYPYNNSFNCLIFTAPADAAYTRINFLNSDLTDGTTLKSEWYFRDITKSVWAKKNILVMGDSISTDVYGSYIKWVTDLIDEAFFSTGYTTNNSQHATGFVATYASDASTTFPARLESVGDLSGFDAIITFGGINDWIQSIDFDTFKTAVDNYFAYLLGHAPQAKIIVLSPLRTALYGTTNQAGKTQKDYDDYIKSVAAEYAFPCLNLTDESGFCPEKSSTFSDMWTLLPTGYSDHDGVHPIETWEKNFLAPMIKGFLTSIG